MYLSPEERQVGKENFNTAAAHSLSRRDLLKGTIAAGVVAGGGLGTFYYGYGKSLGKPLRVGVIGTGDEGNVLLGAVNPEFIHVVAIADIRPYNVYRAFHGDWYTEDQLKARPGLMAKYGWKTEDEARKHVKVYQDYKELINDPDVEAVVIGLPLHLHAPVAIEAMRRGKHVLTEKLMAKTVGDAKEMARVADQTGRILAVGHQRHYNILYDNAVDMIKSGLLGKIHYIHAQWHRGNMPLKDSWAPALPPGVRKVLTSDDKEDDQKLVKQLKSWKKRLEEAKGKEIELWQKRVAQLEAQFRDKEVDAAKYQYESKVVKDAAGKVQYEASPLEELIRWRIWQRTGGGLMVELGSHQLDAASIFIAAQHGGKKQHPLNVSAVANRNLFEWTREIEDHIHCVLEFPAPDYDPKDPLKKLRKIAVAYSSIEGNRFGGYGEIVYGTKGTLIIEQEKESMLFSEADTKSKIEVKDAKGGPTMDTQASPGGHAAAQGAAAIGPDVSRGYREELDHWAWCIRNPDPNNKPRCRPEVALGDAVIALTTNIAARKGLRIDFKEEWFDHKRPETPETDPEISKSA
jgi:predicted dehydrogenase